MVDVLLGDGYKVRGIHICPAVVVEMQGVELQQSLHVWRIKGDSSLVKTLVSLKSMMRNLRKGGQGYLIEFGQMAVETMGEELPKEIQGLLEQFPTIHEPIQGLPPRRVRDHAIEIKQGEQPPNIRPYQYLHSQKA